MGQQGKGLDWKDVTGSLRTDLPDADYLEIVGNPRNLNQLFLATNVGVFWTNNGLAHEPTWYRYMTGLPAVIAAFGIELNYDNAPMSGSPLLHIGSYGRGFWEREVVNYSMRGGYVPGVRDVPGTPLRMWPAGPKSDTGDLVLDWSPSCAAGDTDYAVYEGNLGNFTTHAPVKCSTGGETWTTVTPSPGDRYYLVVPLGRHAAGWSEGSAGLDSEGNQRPVPASSCHLRYLQGCS
jgi:hypothetical protein